jgi:hypothetical protein
MVIPVPLLRQRDVVTLQPSMAYTGYGPKGVITLTTWAPKMGAQRTMLKPTKRIRDGENVAGRRGCQVAVVMLVKRARPRADQVLQMRQRTRQRIL